MLGLFAQQAGLTLEQTLIIAGSSPASVKQ
jgi:hypothetical protein